MAQNEYNWLDDPFDEKKNQQLASQQMSTASKLALGLGCVGALVVLVAIVLLFAGALATIASEAVV